MIDNTSIIDALIITGIRLCSLPKTLDCSDESAKRIIDSVKKAKAIQ
jgi:hypothetical protein